MCDCALLAAKRGFEKHENGGKVAYELGYQLFFVLNTIILHIEQLLAYQVKQLLLPEIPGSEKWAEIPWRGSKGHTAGDILCPNKP